MYFHRRQTCTKRLSKPKFVTCNLKSELKLLSAIHYPNSMPQYHGRPQGGGASVGRRLPWKIKKKKFKKNVEKILTCKRPPSCVRQEVLPQKAPRLCVKFVPKKARMICVKFSPKKAPPPC